MKSEGATSRIFSFWVRSVAFGLLVRPAMAVIKPLVKGASNTSAAVSDSIHPGGFMSILEQITQAFTSHFTMIVLSIAAVATLQAILDAYTSCVRESAKAVHKFSYTSPVGETITVDSSKSLEVAHLRGLISTCNSQPAQNFHPTRNKERGLS
jgi:hypothetical protein